jgi:hypothetical protein
MSPDAGCSKSKTGVHTATAFPGGVEERTEVTVTVLGCPGDDVTDDDGDAAGVDVADGLGGGVDAPVPDGLVPPPHAARAAAVVAAADQRLMRSRTLIVSSPSCCSAIRVR